MSVQLLNPLTKTSLPASVQLMAQVLPFQCSAGAAAVLDANPSVAMHLSAEGMRLPGPALERPVWVELLDRDSRHILDYHGRPDGKDAVFYAPKERDSQVSSAGRIVVPDYPRPLTAFKFFLWRAKTDADLACRLRGESPPAHYPLTLFRPVLTVDHRGQRRLYQSTDPLAFYKMLHRLNLPRNSRFIDLGCGIGAILFIASLFFDRVVGIETVEMFTTIIDEAIGQFEAQNEVSRGAVQIVQEDMRLLQADYFTGFNIAYGYTPFASHHLSLIQSFSMLISIYRKFAPGTLILNDGGGISFFPEDSFKKHALTDKIHEQFSFDLMVRK